MLNDKVIAQMSDSEKTSYENIRENYWQASDDYGFAKNDTEWCLINNCSVDDAYKYFKLAEDVLYAFEETMRNRYSAAACN